MSCTLGHLPARVVRQEQNIFQLKLNDWNNNFFYFNLISNFYIQMTISSSPIRSVPPSFELEFQGLDRIWSQNWKEKEDQIGGSFNLFRPVPRPIYYYITYIIKMIYNYASYLLIITEVPRVYTV